MALILTLTLTPYHLSTGYFKNPYTILSNVCKKFIHTKLISALNKDHMYRPVITIVDVVHNLGL